jgi:hypothetical protein
MNRCDNTVDILNKTNIDTYSQYYLAITMIMAKCKFVLCANGNCSLWIALFRGNSDNIFHLYEDHVKRLQWLHSFELKDDISLNKKNELKDHKSFNKKNKLKMMFTH